MNNRPGRARFTLAAGKQNCIASVTLRLRQFIHPSAFAYPMIHSRSTFRIFLGLLTFATIAAFAAGADSDPRVAFLKLIDRPRVPLAPEIANAIATDNARFTQTAFSFAADAHQRVPGLLVKARDASPSAVKRRPVVIALHGTGGTKEGQIPLLDGTR